MRDDLLARFDGAWEGEETIATTRWGEGGPALAQISARLALGGRVLLYEGRFRPPEHHVKKWTDYQADKIKRGLTALEADSPSLDPLPNVGQLALACFLGHRDLRFAGDWRAAHPKLVTWLDRFAAKVPAFAETKVAA